MNKKIVMLGPTSSGKTILALSLCKEFDGEIVSVDSRQIYKHMDIGTGKSIIGHQCMKLQNRWQIDNVNIWGYDLAKPNEEFSVVDYHDYISSLKLAKDITVFVGGTGFYFDVLLGNKRVSGALPNKELREELGKITNDKLLRKLIELNPQKAAVVDANNPHRLIRAIEIEMAGGSKEIDYRFFDEHTLVVGLTSSRDVLYARVDAWVDSIYDSGLVEEVEALIKMGFQDTKPVSGLVYSSVVSYLSGNMDLASSISETKFNCHAYIRRQETYFRKIPNVVWLDILSKDFDIEVRRLVESKLNE